MKKAILAVIAVFVGWIILDFIIHVLILGPTYEATKELWRPEGEMKMWLMYLVSLLSAIFFVWIYYQLIPKSFKNGLIYGILFGLATGISMGYGTYSVQPIPYVLALGWFLGTVVETTVAGALVGWIVTEEKTEEAEKSN
ncbi:MAG: hypothetical protein GXO77_13475 [Calditrichaeota bacterium]|nr:hypothetical protein [Calditrichota bacterium]